MTVSQQARTRKLTIIAQDPSVCDEKNKIITTQVDVLAEDLKPGPFGYRVQVIDYDASTNTFYKPLDLGMNGDQYKKKSNKKLLTDPKFHCQNVYALVMRTLARFEFALGRRVSWSFYGHNLKVVPHAFADANAFYSKDDHALMFGYFRSTDDKKTIFTCLSHDVVVHETTHALVDGLRRRYIYPSSPDQAAFHEGFSDIVAILSVFSLPDVVRKIIDLSEPVKNENVISEKAITKDKLRKSGIMGLAEEMGREIPDIRGNALRRSAELEPRKSLYKDPEYIEPHLRGEIFVAAIINAMLEIWKIRISTLGTIRKGFLNRDRVVEEGAEIANKLLTIVIRALDYSPSVDIQFGDFLSALLTADTELYQDDTKYDFRNIMLKSFRSYGIEPPSKADSIEGTWKREQRSLRYDRTHFKSMRTDPDEVFRFIWENREELGLHEEAYSRVISVRPCIRIGPDGFVLHETVAEFIQNLDMEAEELKRYDIKIPAGMPASQKVTIYGGGALIFDEYGRLKFNVHNRLLNKDRQSDRLKYLWEYGYFKKGSKTADPNFSNIHRQRAIGARYNFSEEW